jgi:uncharacterized protein
MVNPGEYSDVSGRTRSCGPVKSGSEKIATFEFNIKRMRLTDRQIEQITSIGQGIYGNEVRIYLFGSRVFDEKMGGDIDLFIETDDLHTTTIENKIRFLVKLKLELGDQKIDLVYPNNLSGRPSFRNSIFNSRMRL